jgi:hypothetical protein
MQIAGLALAEGNRSILAGERSAWSLVPSQQPILSNESAVRMIADARQ